MSTGARRERAAGEGCGSWEPGEEGGGRGSMGVVRWMRLASTRRASKTVDGGDADAAVSTSE